MPLKAVFFDYGGTLDAEGTAWKTRFYPLYRRFGIDVAPQRFDRAFYRADDSLTAEADPQMTLEEVLHEQVRRVLDGLGCEGEKHVRDIAGAFFRQSLNQVRRNLPVLEKLAKTFRLGIISNNYGNLAAICRQTGLADCMQVLVDSALVGVAKPHPLIFRQALAQMDVRPADAVMVGDSLPRDIRGARAMGMGAVWLSSEKPLPPDLAADPQVAVIKALNDLPDTLWSWTQTA